MPPTTSVCCVFCFCFSHSGKTFLSLRNINITSIYSRWIRAECRYFAEVYWWDFYFWSIVVSVIVVDNDSSAAWEFENNSRYKFENRFNKIKKSAAFSSMMHTVNICRNLSPRNTKRQMLNTECECLRWIHRKCHIINICSGTWLSILVKTISTDN